MAQGCGDRCRPVIALNEDCAGNALGLGVINSVTGCCQAPCPRNHLRDCFLQQRRMEGSGDRQELNDCLERSATGQVLFQRAVRGYNLSLKLTAAGFKIARATGKNNGTRAVDNGQRNGRTLNGLGNHRGRQTANGKHRGRFAQVCRAQTDAD